MPFLDQLHEALKGGGYAVRAKLVSYYDEEVFHGEFPMADVPFMKQKRFSYQREFRLCVDTRTQRDSAITVDIGDISHICTKVEAKQLPGLIRLVKEPPPPASSTHETVWE